MPSIQAHGSFHIVRLPGRMRSALRPFRAITGLSAVTSLVSPVGGAGQSLPLSPPVHPRCARQLRSVKLAPPCRHEWSVHMRSSQLRSGVQSHRCPLGLSCSCVPIVLDGNLVGVAKLVAGPETSARDFSAATRVLELIVSGVCQESLVSTLSEELATLRECLAQLRRVQCQAIPPRDALERARDDRDPRSGQHENLNLVDRALVHLHTHYQTPALSLPAVAECLACNPRYLTARFTRIVGERMHAYLVRLRVSHACRLLMDTNLPVKEVAYTSGFCGNTPLARAFRRHVGVSPLEYRRVFGAG